VRVAICDDNITALKDLNDRLKNIKYINSVTEFDNIHRFWDSVEDGSYFDIVFMDIDWKQEQTGIDFAAVLYKKSPSSQIIYITGYNDLFSQQILLNEANLCGYLTKPIDDGLLLQFIEKAERNRKSLYSGKLLLQNKGVIHSLNYNEIVYIESAAHQCIAHTDNSLISCYEKLDEINERLPKEFVRCHKSYLVNMNYIKKISDKMIVLKNETQIPISKAQYAHIKDLFFTYIGKIL